MASTLDDAHEMRDLLDHATIGGSVLDGRLPADLVQAEALQGRALIAGAADAAAGLDDGDGGVGHLAPPYESDASASTPMRRDWIAETLRLRRAATERGLSSRAS